MDRREPCTYTLALYILVVKKVIKVIRIMWNIKSYYKSRNFCGQKKRKFLFFTFGDFWNKSLLKKFFFTWKKPSRTAKFQEKVFRKVHFCLEFECPRNFPSTQEEENTQTYCGWWLLKRNKSLTLRSPHFMIAFNEKPFKNMHNFAWKNFPNKKLRKTRRKFLLLSNVWDQERGLWDPWSSIELRNYSFIKQVSHVD